MAFRKTLSHSFTKISSSFQAPTLTPRSSGTNSAPTSLIRRLLSDSVAGGEDSGLVRRFLQRRPLYHSTAAVPVPPDRFPALPVGDQLMDRILELNRERIRLEGIVPPHGMPSRGITVVEAKKATRAAQMEAARAKLRDTGRSCVSYPEFAQMCGKIAGAEQGVGLARELDESGAVIVLRDAVFLRPDLVAKAIESVIPLSMAASSDPRRKELSEMKEKKAAIDMKAEAEVRRELWAGLGLLMLQTLGFVRLTFWELSWDVMEPICFYVTSFYFMAGYAFFLRTSRDPSFEGFFQSRFQAKQKRLMDYHGFDINRFKELQRGGQAPWHALDEDSSFSSSSSSYSEDCHHRNALFGAVH
ncbi:calcium uniporter protein 2, mitochondrial-like [Typha latifolia]|uniref:calcium uniporter protein 2, mitochondrial-like n=1 Tax=Typha latifolia TaxID=4733 RepID=UPI003C2DF8A6